MRKGIAEVVGIPRPVVRAFSRRRAEIDAALAERGTSGARAAEAAALATRAAKDARVAPETLLAEWRTRAAGLGFDREMIRLVTGHARSREPERRDWERAWTALAASTGLARRSSTFSRADVIQALCEALPPTARIDARALELAVDRFLGSSRAVPLVPEAGVRETGESFRRRDGRLMPAGADARRYSTPEHLALEQRLVDRAVASRASGVAVVGGPAVQHAMAAHPTLSEEQRRVVESLCRDGDGVAVVCGRAGTGKTFALSAAREAWQETGHPVLGVATARRAADGLREGAGIQSTSIAALLAVMRRDGARLPHHAVLVVDEAGMVATRELSELLDHVERADGKLVLVGDHRQLPELEAGGAFRGLVQRGLAVELTENVRQVNRWERKALVHLRTGEPEQALALYSGHNRLIIEPTAAATHDRLVRDWLDSEDRDGSVMIAQRRADVAELNARARALLRAAGEVTGAELHLPGGAFAVGDRVVVKRNDPARDVHNGQRGAVVGVDRERCSLMLRCGDRSITLDRDYLTSMTQDGDPTLLHGYAITGHVAQGVTVNRSFVLAADGMNREWAYVALSQGRESNRLYVSAQPDDERAEFAPISKDIVDPVERLAAQLRTSVAQVLALDAGRPEFAGLDIAAVRQQRLDAEREAALAERERRNLERRRSNWLPGRRQELDDARRRERVARARLARARRVEAEVDHGRRPFATGHDADRAVEQLHDLVSERATQRMLQRGREIERER